ncbi:MAG: zinc ABC transporter substrate-binding protein [Chlamydiia bacterium]|nr:zinc ABC transporter substrate-binding protein [Chlamydiia bacterium]
MKRIRLRRKLRFVVHVAMFFCCLTGCQFKQPDVKYAHFWENNGKIKVLSTIEMIHDLVVQIGGEHIDAISLLRGELDPHSYELVKGDDEKFIWADLIFYNGLGLEHGLSLRQQLEGNPKAFAVGDPIFEGDPAALLLVDSVIDPHIWLDVSLWKRIIPTIVSALSDSDPLHAAAYQVAGTQLEERLDEVDRQALITLQNIPDEARYIVTSHDAFNYFTRRYLATEEERKKGGWECRFSAPEGLAPDAELSQIDLRDLLDHVISYRIAVLFPESNVSRDSLNKIQKACQKLGHSIHISKNYLYGDAMGGAASYCEMIEHNVSCIARELSHASL